MKDVHDFCHGVWYVREYFTAVYKNRTLGPETDQNFQRCGHIQLCSRCFNVISASSYSVAEVKYILIGETTYGNTIHSDSILSSKDSTN